MIDIWLNIQAWWRRWRNITGRGAGPDLSGYKLKETLSVTNVNYGFHWYHKDDGTYLPIHPEEDWQYHNNDCISIKDDLFELALKRLPKTYQAHLYPYAKAVIESKQTYLYGYFECEMLLPEKAGQWPAFWATAKDKWPCEIDFTEAYSRSDNYKDYRKMQSNVHYETESGEYKKLGAKDHPMPPAAIKNKFFHVGVIWEPDRIEWWYHGYLVRVLTDKAILKALELPMFVHINSGCQPQYQIEDSVTLFRNVKVYQR